MSGRGSGGGQGLPQRRCIAALGRPPQRQEGVAFGGPGVQNRLDDGEKPAVGLREQRQFLETIPADPDVHMLVAGRVQFVAYHAYQLVGQ